MKNIRVGAIIQARMNSSRLPGKVLLTINGTSVLSNVIQRVMRSKLVNTVIVATTNSVIDDLIVIEALKNGVDYYRGSENNVLSRYFEAAKQFDLDFVVRITSDCPLISYEIIDSLVSIILKEKYEIVTNAGLEEKNRTFPRGLDVEVFTMDILAKAYNNAESDYHYEHVTPWIYENSNNIRYIRDLDDFSDFRLTLDTLEDYLMINMLSERLSNIYEHSYSALKVVLEGSHELKSINENIVQKKVKL